MELGKNKEVQDKLREELFEAMPTDADVTYDAIVNLPYLDQVWNGEKKRTENNQKPLQLF